MAWVSQSGPPILDGEDELQMKVEFAEFLARNPGKAREAAYMVFRADTDQQGKRYFGRAMQAIGWESDPFVQEELQRLRVDEKSASLHPSDDEVDLEILDAARAAINPGDKAKLYDLYLNARGRATKAAPNTNVNIDNRTVTNVLSVPQRMTIDQAKQAFADRQAMRTIPNARAANGN